MNAVVLGLALFPMNDVLRRAVDNDVRRAALRLIAWWPSLWLVAGLVLKDSLALFFGLLLLSSIEVERGRIQFGKAAVAAASLWLVRIDILIPLLAVGWLWLLLWPREERAPSRRALVWVYVLVMTIAVVAISLKYGTLDVRSALKEMGAREMIAAYAESEWPDSNMQRLAVRQLTDVWKLPIGLAMTAVGQLPFARDGSLYGAIAGVANIPFVVVLPFCLIGLGKLTLRDSRRTLPIWAILLAGLAYVAVAWLGVPRYRDTFLPFLLIATAQGWKEWRVAQRTLVALYAFEFLALMYYFFILKAEI
jgi:hypothetical protein